MQAAKTTCQGKMTKYQDAIKRIEGGNGYQIKQRLQLYYVVNRRILMDWMCRYVKAHNFADAIKLLRSGALLLLQHKQAGSGADLALYMVEVYNLDKVPVTEESRGNLIVGTKEAMELDA